MQTVDNYVQSCMGSWLGWSCFTHCQKQRDQRQDDSGSEGSGSPFTKASIMPAFLNRGSC